MEKDRIEGNDGNRLSCEAGISWIFQGFGDDNVVETSGLEDLGTI